MSISYIKRRGFYCQTNQQKRTASQSLNYHYQSFHHALFVVAKVKYSKTNKAKNVLLQFTAETKNVDMELPPDDLRAARATEKTKSLP